MRIRIRDIPAHGTALIAFTLLTVIYLLPFNPFYQLSHNIYGGDAFHHAWAPAWFCHALLNGLPLFDANILAPLPDSLAYSEGDFGVGVQSLLLWPFSHNAVLNFNLLTYLSFVLAGLGVYYLVRELAPGARLAAMFGGIVYAFNCFRGWRVVGHLTILQMHWFPFALLFLIRSLREPKASNVLLFGLFTLLLFLSNFYLAAIAMIFYLLFALLLLLLGEFRISRSHLSIVLVLLLDLCLLSAFLFPYLGVREERVRILDDAIGSSADFGGYLFPPVQGDRFTTLMGNVVSWLDLRKTHTGENTIFFGYLVLVLGLLRIVQLVRRRWLRLPLEAGQKVELTLLLCAAVFFLLSLGPYLWWRDEVTSLRLPYYYLYKFFPPVRFMRAPVRFGIVVVLAFSCLAAIALHTILKRLPRAASRIALFAALSLYTFGLEFLHVHTFATQRIEDNAIYQWLREEKNQGNNYMILTLPAPNRAAMLHSTLHWHSVMSGSFYPGNHLQDLFSIMDWKPSVVWLLDRYRVDYVIAEKPEEARKLRESGFLVEAKQTDTCSLFGIRQREFAQLLEEQNREREEKLRSANKVDPIVFKDEPLRELLVQRSEYFRRIKGSSALSLVTRTGSVLFSLPDVNPFAYRSVRIKMRAWSGVDSLCKGTLYWHTSEEPKMNEKKKVQFNVLLDGQEHIYRISLANHYQWLYYGNIRGMKVEFLSGKDNGFELVEIALLP